MIVSDYNKGLLSHSLLSKIFYITKENQIPVFVDPKTSPFIKYSGADIIKPNRKDTQLETGIDLVDNDAIKNACSKIFEKTGIKKIVITLSEDGVAIFENNNLRIIATEAKEIFDVTGAGYTFIAALSYSIMQNKNLVESCEFANYAAACVISKMGSSTTTINEIDKIKNKFIN